MSEGEGMLVGNDSFMHKTGLHPYRRKLITEMSLGRMAARAMNMTSEDVKIPAGQKYGLFALMPTVTESAETEATKNWTASEKEDWLCQEFQLNSNPLLKKNDRLKKVLQMLQRHWTIFSTDGAFGKTELIQHDIHTEAVPPIKTRFRPLNPKLEKNLKEQLEEWMKHDVIEVSNSPWSFALVAVKKKNGKIRWCIDYRKLNEITKKDAFPLPFIEDNLARLADSNIFSAIDGMGAFHVVELTEEARPKTAFATPWGTYHFKRMPFGLSNGPATYSRLMQMTLQGIPTTMALPYLDDTIIHADGFDAHLDNLDKVLEAHEKAGLKLQPSKCKLFQEETEYLGHLVSKDGIRPVPEYTEIVRNWPLPTTVTQTRAFLGKVGYYRRFLKDYARRSKPWTDAIRDDPEEGHGAKDRPVTVTPAMEAAFQDLREALVTAPILAYPRFDEESIFILDTDWSQDSGTIGAVLSQLQTSPEGKKTEKVISYAAKKLSDGQLNYPPTKGELLAAITFMKHWHYYLSFQPFVLRTDHQALTWIRTMERPTGMILRWLETLATFEFTVQHRSGVQHGNADALSRISHAPPVLPEEEEDEAPGAIGVNAIVAAELDTYDWTDAATRLCQLRQESQNVNWFHREKDHVLTFLQELKQDVHLPDSVEEWVLEQEHDLDLKQIREWTQNDTWPEHEELRSHSTVTRHYADEREKLWIDEMKLLRYVDHLRQDQDDKTGVICIPSQLQREVVWIAHRVAGHRGVNATVERVISHGHFPGVMKMVREMLSHCEACQRKGGAKKDQTHTLASVTDGYPFQRLSLDFVGPLPRSSKGHYYLLTIKDTFTRWVEAFPLTSATAEAVAIKLEKEVFPRFGYPESIHSDRGAQFTSHLLDQLCKEFDLVLTHTPAYNPKSNPVERAHRDMKGAFKALTDSGNDWEALLPHVLFAMRTTVCVSTGYSPFQLMFGRDPSIPLLAIQQVPERKNLEVPIVEYMTKIRERLAEAQHLARTNIAGAVRRQRRYYRRTVQEFDEGDKVWLYTPPVGAHVSRKFHLGWTGPWTVVERITRTVYLLHPEEEWEFKSPLIISGDRLKPYFVPEERKAQYEPPAGAVSEEFEHHGNEQLEHLEFVTPGPPQSRQAPGESDESEEEGDEGRKSRFRHSYTPLPVTGYVRSKNLPAGPARIPAPIQPPDSSQWVWKKAGREVRVPTVHLPDVDQSPPARRLRKRAEPLLPARVPNFQSTPKTADKPIEDRRGKEFPSFSQEAPNISQETIPWQDGSDSEDEEVSKPVSRILQRLTTSSGWQQAPQQMSGSGRRQAAVQGELNRREATGIPAPAPVAPEE
jgi:transposase InsO family protein